jgi:hypothetical protein
MDQQKTSSRLSPWTRSVIGGIPFVGGGLLYLASNVHRAIANVDNSAMFAAIMLLILNFGSRISQLQLPHTMDSGMRQVINRYTLVFAIVWVSMRSLYVAFITIFTMWIVALYMPTELKDAVDTDGDGHVSKEEIQKAMETLRKMNEKVA